VYGALPPVGLAVNVTDSPALIDREEGVIVPALKGTLIVTVSPAEQDESGTVELESVTRT
jgi:hypothetical protein